MSREDDVLIETYFKIFDVNNDNSISTKELGKLFKVIFITVPKGQKVTDLLAAYDTDDNGTLDLEEFKKLYYSLGVRPKGDSLGKLFSKYDNDGDGNLSKEEVRKFLQDTHDKDVTDDVVNCLMEKTDLDASGGVSFEEFIRMFINFISEDEKTD